ncbi:MAG: hypothetical protein LBL90_07875 [Prevotellaceae bacterium]|jgi:hypothetical protein|nr:hypothetical protein [Prevotellaceae bacterium]
MALIKISFFKTQKHRIFNYTPRHYDPAKEELEERIRKVEREAGYLREEDKDKPYVSHIKGQFKRNLDNLKRTKEVSYNKRIRYFIVLASMAILFIAMYYMMRLLPHLFYAE